MTFLPCTPLFLLAPLWLTSILSCPGWGQDRSSEQGVVIGLTGEWTPQDKGPLNLGDPISVGVKIAHKAPATLTVWFEGHSPTSYSCPPSQEQSCPGMIKPPVETNKSTSPLKRVMDETFALLASSLRSMRPKEPSRYFTAASRGLEGELKEAVLLLQGSQVDIAPAFADLSAGSYWVRFDSPGDGRRKTAATQVQWQPGKPALVSAAGLKLGLYQLSLLEQSGEPASSEAWILLSGTQEYSATAARFQEVASTVATWPAGADPSAIRAVLRACLDALSKHSEG